MTSVEILTSSGEFTNRQAALIGIDGADVLFGGWKKLNYVLSSPFQVRKVVGTYVSATSFTVPGDITSYVYKGMKYRLLNNLVLKQGYIASASFAAGVTTITTGPQITANQLTSNPITEIYFSNDPCPAGHPFWIERTPTATGFSVAPTFKAYYSVVGLMCTENIVTTVSGTSNLASFGLNTALQSANFTNFDVKAYGNGTNNGVYEDNVFIQLGANSNSMVLQVDGGLGNFAAANAKGANFQITYGI